MRRYTALGMLTAVALVSACKVDPAATQNSDQPAQGGQSGTASAGIAGADAMASHDSAPGSPQPGTAQDLSPMQLQVVLERLGFAPGVVDGKPGFSTENAIRGFQKANDLTPTGKVDDATRAKLSAYANIPATREVTIPDDFAAGPFMPVPKEPEDQAKMPKLGYASLDEKLAERFHTTIDTLKSLNKAALQPAAAPSPAPQPSPTPSAGGAAPAPSVFRAGQKIQVPNVGADALDPSKIDDRDWLSTMRDLGVGSDQAKVDKVVVSKSKKTLEAYDAGGKLVAVFTATMGSSHDPLPIGTWKIQGVSRNPKFHYNPKLFWDADSGDKKQTLPPGPNGPVGVVWIDLSKPHYGIHGTTSPETIGRAESHGCVRLTNWDAARLAQMVHGGTVAVFEK